MFDESSKDLFANVEPDFRPDADEGPRLPPGQAHVDAMPGHRSGIGRSPDGIGRIAPIGAWGGGMAGPMAGQLPIEPTDVSTGAAVRSAGITTLTVAVAFGGGLALGGWRGGIAGILIAGSLFNGYRAQKWWGSPDPSDKHEAVVSTIMGIVGIVGGGYTAYKAYEHEK
jgi:hypothetical protein